MPLNALIQQTRTRYWNLSAAVLEHQQVERLKHNAYMCRYMREVYYKGHKQRSVTLSGKQDQQLRDAAAAHGRKPAVLLREAAFAYLDGEAVLPATLQAELAAHTLEVRRIGTNINQIAHQANIRPEDATAGLARAITLLAELEAAPARYLSAPPSL